MKYFKENENFLIGKFEFPNFQKALDFVNVVGNVAEISNHHPDILLHKYKHITIKSTTHDAGNMVIDKDRVLAKRIEQVYSKL